MRPGPAPRSTAIILVGTNAKSCSALTQSRRPNLPSSISAFDLRARGSNRDWNNNAESHPACSQAAIIASHSATLRAIGFFTDDMFMRGLPRRSSSVHAGHAVCRVPLRQRPRAPGGRDNWYTRFRMFGDESVPTFRIACRNGDEFGVRRTFNRGGVTPRNVTNSDEAKVKGHFTSRI